MAKQKVTYSLNSVFNKYRRGTAKILNPRTLTVTVDGGHASMDKYVKFAGNSHELAEIHATGIYGGPKRTFMYDLYRKLKDNTGNFAKEIIGENMKYDKYKHGWYVDWWNVSQRLEDVCIQELMPLVSAEQPPINTKSQYKKSENGYGDMTLYATGQLFESIVVL